MKKFIKVSALLIIVALIILQFFKPVTENPPDEKAKFITAKLQISDNVYQKLEKSCFDCHSHRTVWPWYSKISPVVYLINKDVVEGREHMNFSVWTDYDKTRMIDKLEGIVTEVEDGEMPLAVYTPMHPEAKLSDADKKLITDWAKNAKELLLAGTVNSGSGMTGENHGSDTEEQEHQD